MTDHQEHYVTFDTMEGGEHSLCLFIESVPETWHADFYELDRHGHFITQHFRTEHAIERFIATPLVRDLPGTIDWSWNSEREEIIAELQSLTKKASDVHEEINTLLGSHRFCKVERSEPKN